MSQPPLQDTAAAQCDVADAAEGGTGEFRVRSKVSAQNPAGSSARDWAAAGGGVRLPAWNNVAVTASVTASVTPNQTTTNVSRLGVVRNV